MTDHGWTPHTRPAKVEPPRPPAAPKPASPLLAQIRCHDAATVDHITRHLPIGPTLPGMHNLQAVEVVIDEAVPAGHVELRFGDGTRRTVSVTGDQR